MKEHKVSTSPAPNIITSLFKKLLYLMQWLNLDVVAGALAVHLMAQRLMGQAIEQGFHYVALGAAVFVIYSLDRLSDIDILEDAPSTRRHRFYFLYKKELLILTLLIALGTGLGALFLLPWQELLFGAGLGCMAVLYLWLVRTSGEHRRHWLHKELFVAFIYSAGIWGSAAIYQESISWQVWALVPVFCIIALQNLLLFSLFEVEVDQAHKQRSMARSLGPKGSTYVLHALFGLVFITLILLGFFSPSAYYLKALLVLALMSGILHLLFIYKASSQHNEFYRWAGDGVFLLPLLLLI